MGQQAREAVLKPAVIVNIQRQPGANIIGVVDEVQKILPQLRSSIASHGDAAGADGSDEYDSGFGEGCAVFAGADHWLGRNGDLPVSAVDCGDDYSFGRGAALDCGNVWGDGICWGYSLNNLSLMALTISTGFVVDDAIVMIENIARYLEQGDSPLEAALKGSEQIGFTIVSLTVSLIAVLIPLLFMGDIVGRLFREFAVTLAVTIPCFGAGVADVDADDVGEAVEAYAGE